MGLDYYYTADNLTATVVANNDDSDTVTIKFDKPADRKDAATYSQRATKERENGRKIHIVIEGLLRSYSVNNQ